MTLDQLKLALDIVVVIVTLPMLFLATVTSLRVERVRQEQRRVAASLAQVEKDGKELRLFLDAQNKKESIRVLKP